MSDVELQSLLALTGLAVLSLTHSSVTDAGLRGVGQTLTALAELGLSSCTRLTDEGLRALSPLTGLKSLDLSLTNVTEEGLRALAPLTRLEYLVISRPAPTVSLYHCYCITVTVSLYAHSKLRSTLAGRFTARTCEFTARMGQFTAQIARLSGTKA